VANLTRLLSGSQSGVFGMRALLCDTTVKLSGKYLLASIKDGSSDYALIVRDFDTA